MLRLNLFTSLLFFHATLLGAESETLVTAERPALTKDAEKLPGDEEKATPGYPWLALTGAGLSATPSSGALSFGTLRFRGYSSPQMRILVDEYDLSDVGTGLFNAYDLPLFASDGFDFIPGVADNALGASLKVSLNVPDRFKAKARSSFGSHGFAMMDTLAGTGDHSGSKALVGFQLGSSRGDFDVGTGPRLNNDQSRMLSFVKAEHAFKNADLSVFAFGRQQEGGLPGPETFGPSTVRLFSQKAVLGSTFAFELGSFPVSINWQTRYNRNESTHDNVVENLAFLDNTLRLIIERKFELADTFSGLESTFSQSEVLDGRYRRLFTRQQMNFDTAPFSFWGLRFKRSFGVDVYSDAGWFLNFRTHISAKPIDDLTIGLRFGRNSRAPTLGEMHAVSGYIIANPNLEPEKVHDGSLYVTYEMNKKLSVNVDLFYSHMSKAIFYVNRDSSAVEPINGELAQRLGVGTSLFFQPTDYFEMRARGDWLWTRNKESDGPLPYATPLAISIDSRVGNEKGIFGRLNVIANAGSTSDLLGTLKTPAYVLINTSLHIPLLEHARVIFSATNLANVTWAKSAYNYPMPGREFFVTFEVNS